jgi:hypothetical protein
MQSHRGNTVVAVLFYKREMKIMELIKTIQTMAPHIHKNMIYHDLTDKSFDNFPVIVKQLQQLPILVSKGINEPLVGVASIQKWLAQHMYQSNQEKATSEMRTESNKDLPTIFKKNKDDLDGFLPGEMLGSISNYSYFNDNMNHSMECNFEKLVGFKGNLEKTQDTSGFSETKSNKNSDTVKRFDAMMNERKKLLESQNTGNVINL